MSTSDSDFVPNCVLFLSFNGPVTTTEATAVTDYLREETDIVSVGRNGFSSVGDESCVKFTFLNLPEAEFQCLSAAADALTEGQFPYFVGANLSRKNPRESDQGS